jgi:hypothetical protein
MGEGVRRAIGALNVGCAAADWREVEPDARPHGRGAHHLAGVKILTPRGLC